MAVAGEDGTLVSEGAIDVDMDIDEQGNGSSRMDQCNCDPICPVKCGAPMGSEVKTGTNVGRMVSGCVPFASLVFVCVREGGEDGCLRRCRRAVAALTRSLGRVEKNSSGALPALAHGGQERGAHSRKTTTAHHLPTTSSRGRPATSTSLPQPFSCRRRRHIDHIQPICLH
jgi:hypothetical protein